MRNIKKMQNSICISAAKIDKNYLYAANNDFSNLYCYNISTHIVEFVVSFPEKKNKTRYFGGVEINGDLILLIPCSAENAYILNKKTNKYVAIKIDDVSEDYIQEAKFISGFFWRDKVILLPASYPGICIYDVSSGEKVYLKEWIKEIRELFPYYSNTEGYFRKACIKNDKIYAPFCGCNCLMILDLESCKYTFKIINNNDIGYSAIAEVGDKLILTSRGRGNVLFIDVECNVEHEIIIDYNPSITRFNFGEIAVNNQNIYLLPHLENRIIIIKNKESIEEIVGGVGVENVTFCGYFGGQMVVFDSKNKNILTIKDNQMVSIGGLPFAESDLELYKSMKSEVYCIFKSKGRIDSIIEKSVFDLKYFVKYIQSGIE